MTLSKIAPTEICTEDLKDLKGKKGLRGSRNLERPANAAHRIVVYFPVAGNSGSLSVSRIPPH